MNKTVSMLNHVLDIGDMLHVDLGMAHLGQRHLEVELKTNAIKRHNVMRCREVRPAKRLQGLHIRD
jgi:hypothetical protein